MSQRPKEVEPLDIEKEFKLLLEKEFPTHIDAVVGLAEFLEKANSLGYRGRFRNYLKVKSRRIRVRSKQS